MHLLNSYLTKNKTLLNFSMLLYSMPAQKELDCIYTAMRLMY